MTAIWIGVCRFDGCCTGVHNENAVSLAVDEDACCAAVSIENVSAPRRLLAARLVAEARKSGQQRLEQAGVPVDLGLFGEIAEPGTALSHAQILRVVIGSLAARHDTGFDNVKISCEVSRIHAVEPEIAHPVLAYQVGRADAVHPVDFSTAAQCSAGEQSHISISGGAGATSVPQVLIPPEFKLMKIGRSIVAAGFEDYDVSSGGSHSGGNDRAPAAPPHNPKIPFPPQIIPPGNNPCHSPSLYS